MKKEKINERRDDIGSIGIGAMIVFIALILVAAVASAVIIQTGEKLQQNAQQTGSDTQEEIGGKISIITMWVGNQLDCDGDDDMGTGGLGAGADVDDKCITLVFELAAGSEPMLESQVVWTISCTDDAGTGLDTVYGSFDGDTDNAGVDEDEFGDGTADITLMHLDTVHVDGSIKVVDVDGDGAIEPGDGDKNDDDILVPGQVYMIDLKTEADDDDLNVAGNAVDGECSPVLNEQHTLTIQVAGGGSTYEVLSYTSVTEGAPIV
jgi:flagellin FlaB